MLYGCGAVLLLALVVLGAANHRFYKAVAAYEWAVEQELTRLHRTHAETLFVGTEKVRIDLLDTLLRDWVNILGEAVHQPWASPRLQFEGLDDDVVAALPASMGVARQTVGDDEIPMTTLVSAYRVVYPQRWASRNFDRAYEAFEAAEPSEPNEGYRSVDLDALDGPVSPRRRLRAFWASGAARDVLTQRAHADLHRAVREGDLELPDRVVGRIGRFADGETGPEPEFFRATATESTTFSTEAFSASGRQARRHYVEQSVAWIPTSARGEVVEGGEVELRHCDGPTAVRIDVSRRTPADDLAMFSSTSVSTSGSLSSQDANVVRIYGAGPESAPSGGGALEDVAWH